MLFVPIFLAKTGLILTFRVLILLAKFPFCVYEIEFILLKSIYPTLRFVARRSTSIVVRMAVIIARCTILVSRTILVPKVPVILCQPSTGKR